MRFPDLHDSTVSAAPDGIPMPMTAQQAQALLAVAMEVPVQERALIKGDRRGDYEIVKKIGDGATCVVYEARHVRTGNPVALKDMVKVDQATEADIKRFRDGALAGYMLCHPNIVPVVAVSDPTMERQFFAMRLIERGSLEDALTNFQPAPIGTARSPIAAARLILKVARAVHHAHLQGVVHRDLKPANILLDDVNEPYVADFGLCKMLDRDAITDESHALLGTLHYVAPEQARGDAKARPFAPDIFSLGVIFYKLLTGRVPYEGLIPTALLRELDNVHNPVPSPRALAPGLGRNFENICLRCLEKDPAKRYRSAEQLADDLESALPVSPWVRAVRWRRRHPRLSAALSVALLVVVAALGAERVQRRNERIVLEKNAFIATGQAGVMLFQLLEDAGLAEQYAKEPAIRALLLDDVVVRQPAALRSRVGVFDSLFVMNPQGYIRAQWPPPAEPVWSRQYLFRDYFRGAMELGARGLSSAYVAPAFRSESHGWLAFAISVPVRDSHGALLGIFVATLNANAAFGPVRLEDSEESERITTSLLGPRGVDRASALAGPGAARPSDFNFVVHPGIEAGTEYTLPTANAAALRAAFGAPAPPGKQFVMRYVPSLKTWDYRDPIPGFDGSWLAASAPVGATGFVVVVQTRRDELLHRGRRLAEQFINSLASATKPPAHPTP
jgi:hypothetical protein